MKKIIITILLFCFMTPAFGAIEPPKWEEFCPAQYVNAEYIQPKTYHPYRNTLISMTIVGLPYVKKDMNTHIFIKANNYWYGRKQEFKKQLTECKNITNETELIYKYTAIRQNELAKNQQRQNQILQAQNEQMRRMIIYQGINQSQTNNEINKIHNKYIYGY